MTTPRPDHITEDGRFYCRRCDTVNCDWLGVCPQTPDLWVTLNPGSAMAKNRHATAAQNAFNQRASYSNAAGVKGVYRLRKSDKWQASIRALGVKRYLGTFRCVTAASFAYARASQELHGSFGRPK